jgi:hypothetical protein
VVAGIVTIVMGTGLAAVVGVAWIMWQAAAYLFGAVG